MKGFHKCFPRWSIKDWTGRLLSWIVASVSGQHDRLSAVRRISLFGDRRPVIRSFNKYWPLSTRVVTDGGEMRTAKVAENRCCVIFVGVTVAQLGREPACKLKHWGWFWFHSYRDHTCQILTKRKSSVICSLSQNWLFSKNRLTLLTRHVNW